MAPFQIIPFDLLKLKHKFKIDDVVGTLVLIGVNTEPVSFIIENGVKYIYLKCTNIPLVDLIQVEYDSITPAKVLTAIREELKNQLEYITRQYEKGIKVVENAMKNMKELK